MVERRIGPLADPLATYQRLRDQGLLGSHAYLRVSPDRAEIGWAPRLTLQLDAGSCAGWRDSVRRIARQAAEAGAKAFGYLPFDLADRDAPFTVPDRSAPLEVRGELFVPSELVTFTATEVVQTTTSGLDLAPYLGDREPAPLRSARELVPASGRTDAEHLEAVRAAVDAIRGGELERVTLSRHRAYDVHLDPVGLFRSLCAPGNFADAYLVELGSLRAVIASPELLLDAARGDLSTHPLVGTRARGATPAEDSRLAQELLSDPKEREEHALCVRTMVEELRSSGCVEAAISSPERPSLFHLLHLQHLGSVLRARLIPGADVVDVLAALFPAVTVTGSPRGPALSLLRRLEAGPRGLYAGAVGWISGQRDCRMSVAIRGLFQYGDRVFVHAGAGITAASDPSAEARESSMKLRAVEQALERAVLH